VIDAPNQQGQDDMQKVMRFIVDKRPQWSQVIVATEDLFGVDNHNASIIHIGNQKNQLLDSNLFEEVSDIIKPYLGQLI